MIIKYIQGAMRLARYEILQDDGTFYGMIPDFQGVYANSETLEDCRNELQEVLEEWLVFKLLDGDTLPVVEGIELAFKRTDE